MSNGRLVYVMGASGVGKNSVIAGARQHLPKSARLYFTHRYVTRPGNGDDDDDVAISRAAFEHYRLSGWLALHWQAHDIDYGIGRVMNDVLRSGATVVVNGSRGHLAAARNRYPELYAVLIHAHPDLLRARLVARGRENAAAIEARVARSTYVEAAAVDAIIDNSGPLARATQALVDVLSGERRPFEGIARAARVL